MPFRILQTISPQSVLMFNFTKCTYLWWMYVYRSPVYNRTKKIVQKTHVINVKPSIYFALPCTGLGFNDDLCSVAGITWRAGVWMKSRRRRSEPWIRGTRRISTWASRGRRRGIAYARGTTTGTTTANHQDTVARAVGTGGDAAEAALVTVALARYELWLVSFHHATFFLFVCVDGLLQSPTFH